MANRVAPHRKHAVSREQAQDAAERLGVVADRCCEFAVGPGPLVQRVGDVEVSDEMKSTRQAVAAGDLR
jgi:hypothetical protein